MKQLQTNPLPLQSICQGHILHDRDPWKSPDALKGVPGHEEIEMALIELYRITENSKYLRLAEEFINQRGKIPNFKTYVINQYLDMISTINLAEKKNQEYQKTVELAIKIALNESEVAEWVSKLTLKGQILLYKENLNGNYIQSNVPVGRLLNQLVTQ